MSTASVSFVPARVIPVVPVATHDPYAKKFFIAPRALKWRDGAVMDLTLSCERDTASNTVSLWTVGFTNVLCHRRGITDAQMQAMLSSKELYPSPPLNQGPWGG